MPVIFRHPNGTTGLTTYVQFWLGGTSFKGIALTESPALSATYQVSDAALVSGGMPNTDGDYYGWWHVGAASDTPPATQALGTVELGWTGTVERPLGSSPTTSGTGADACTLTFQTAGSVPIADADVWITTDVGGSNVVAGTLQTDSSGEVTFMLDDGNTYYAWLQKDGINSITGDEFVAEAD